MSDLQELKRRYRRESSRLPAKQVALLEQEIRNELKNSTALQSRQDMREWFNKELGVGAGYFDNRHALIYAGPWTDVLFDRIDRGMTISTAASLARQSKSLGRAKGIEFSAALKLVLAEYAKKQKIPKLSNAKEKKETDPTIKKQQDAKTFIARVEALARDYAHDVGTDIEQHDLQKITDDFVGMFREAYNDFRRDLNRARRMTKEYSKPKVKIGRVRFNFACEVLSLKYIFGKPIDLREVKRRKNQRAMELHEDRYQHLPEKQRQRMAEELQQVIEAYEIFDSYNEQMQG